VAATVASVWPGSRFAIFRRTYPELDETHSLPLQDEWAGLGRYSKDRREFTWNNGSTTVLRYCEHEGDVIRYQSAEWAGMVVDEATHFTQFQIEYLRSRIRATFPGWRPVILYTANPGNVGHLYFRQQFVDHDPMGGRVWRAGREEGAYRRVFLRARLADNRSLGSAYRRTLEGIKDEAVRRALLEGDWDIFAGQFFQEWRHDQHVCQAFAVPPDWTQRMVSIDFGYGAPWSCHFYARDETLWRQQEIARWFCYREFYEARLRDEEQATRIVLAMDADDAGQKKARGARLQWTVVADPSMWTPHSNTGFSVAQAYKAIGTNLEIMQPADNDRVGGWQRVREYFAPQGDGFPALVFMDTCTEAIRTIPACTRSKTNPEDVDTHGEDHAADDVRYFCQAAGKLASFGAGERVTAQKYGLGAGQRAYDPGRRAQRPGLMGKGIDPRNPRPPRERLLREAILAGGLSSTEHLFERALHRAANGDEP
jgi:phage terminase large subunit